jgi:hypothetical protein
MLFKPKGFQRFGHIVPTNLVVSLRQVELDYHPPSPLDFKSVYKFMGMDDVIQYFSSFYETRLLL